MDHDHKNMALKRPMSPHLDIYGPTLPAMTSIAQRATGKLIALLVCSERLWLLIMATVTQFAGCGTIYVHVM